MSILSGFSRHSTHLRQAVILVGGRGTRLGTFTAETPKPLLPIAGDTRFLDYLLDNVERHGFDDILLLAGHLSQAVVERYNGRTLRNAKLRVIVEPELSGTGGALKYAAHKLDEAFLLMNGDSIIDANYLALTTSMLTTDIGALLLRPVEDSRRYGRVEANNGRVVGFHEKDAGFEGPALISSGVYLLRRSVLDLIDVTPCSIEAEVFPKLARDGKLGALIGEGYFIDIGLPDTLAQARRELPQKFYRGAAFFDRDGTLNEDSGYTHKPSDLRWRSGAIQAIRRCNDAGKLVIVVTNQAGIGRGLYDEDSVCRFHAHMQQDLARSGAHVDAFYYCPHHEDATIPRYRSLNHPDRKPNAGMLRRAMVEWSLNPNQSFLIGDADTDVAAAQAAGIRAAKLDSKTDLEALVMDFLSQDTPQLSTPNPQQDLRRQASRAKEWLFDHALPLWWNVGFDHSAACFHERLNLNGTPEPLTRRIRVQARQTVVYAHASRLGWPGPWREAVEAGAHVLTTKGLRVDGGTAHLLDRDGSPFDERRDLYDAAFVLFALAEASRALGGKADLLSSAAALQDWIFQQWAHPQGGLYEGDITPTPPRRQNPHMHIFEALLAMFEASGDDRFLNRASRIAELFETKFFDSASGALPEYFDETWRPLASEEGQIAEPGHQFEWSWLLHRWEELGGRGLPGIAERLRVHAEVYGVDHASGRVFDEVFLSGHPRTKSSRLWPHTERIKANVMRYAKTGDAHAASAAVQACEVLMSYCDLPVRGLWRDRMLPEGDFIEEASPASSFYHIMVAFSELISRAK